MKIVHGAKRKDGRDQPTEIQSQCRHRAQHSVLNFSPVCINRLFPLFATVITDANTLHNTSAERVTRTVMEKRNRKHQKLLRIFSKLLTQKISQVLPRTDPSKQSVTCATDKTRVKTSLQHLRETSLRSETCRHASKSLA